MTTKNGLPTMTTFSGTLFDFANPTPDMIKIEDIAHALAFECRFQNQCHHFYSVAQHSILVSHFSTPKQERWIKDLAQFKLIGLLHDAAEAYCGDMNKPLKMLLPEYKTIENRIHAAIAMKFGIPQEIPAEIKEMDERILANEGQRVMHYGWNDAKYDPDPEILIGPMSMIDAEKAFLTRFNQLSLQLELSRTRGA